MEGVVTQFTSTCYIVDKEKFLLIFHPKHQKWLPPGGHLEANETPPQAAKREVLEETGLEIEFLLQENLWVEEWNSVSIERPYCCLLETVPARENEPAHQHIDFVYIARPIGGILTDGKWFSSEEIAALKTHEEIFFDTQELVSKFTNQTGDRVDFETYAQKF